MIEAVFEDMDLKKRVFAELDRVAKPGALLATNTSTLDVDAIAGATARPQDVVGTHFFSPANVMRLLEIVRGAESAPDALATALALARRLGKVPAVVGVCYGFVGNRMLARRSVEAERLLLEGALPHEVEAALVEFGLPMGPFAMMDLAGLDVGWLIRKSRGEHAVIEDALCEAGHFGQKTGKGYFRYEAGSRAPIPDPEVERIILDASARLGIARRKIEPNGDRRAHDLADDQRGRAHPRRGHRRAARRHRRDLGVRLWLAGVARRPDVLCRPDRPWAGARPAESLRRAVRRREPAPGGADDPPRRRGQRLRPL